MMTSRKNWTLVAIASAGDRGLTPAQLQKSIFLFQKTFEGDLKNLYSFKPYNYGPFDKTIYVDADELANNGYLARNNGSVGTNWSMYHATPKGKKFAEELEKSLDSKMANHLVKIVTWAQSLTFQQLISTVYKYYPEYRVNSVFKD